MALLGLFRSLAMALSLASIVIPAGANSASAASDEAIVYLRTVHDTGDAALYSPLGASVDDLGNLYVADTSHHRIVKFNPAGTFVRAFSSCCYAPGKLYYPHAIAVGDLPGGGTGIYVSDNGNHRISVFTSGGTFVRAFGSEGGGDGQLQNPSGVAVLPGLSGAGVYVADSRNNRIVRFSLKGKWLQNITCSDCPGGQFHVPSSVQLRKLDGGGWQIYVVDRDSKQVHVLSSNGHYQRSFGGGGALGLPEDVAVDADGSAYVTDPSFNDSNPSQSHEYVARFSPSGKLVSTFKTTGATRFVQPPGVTLDPRGYIYVLDSSSDIFMFALREPELEGIPAEDAAYWIDNKEATFDVNYNGVERTCDINGVARLTVPTNDGNHVFALDGRVEDAGASAARMKMKMTNQQAHWLDQAAPRKTKVVLNLNGRCGGGLKLTARFEFKV